MKAPFDQAALEKEQHEAHAAPHAHDGANPSLQAAGAKVVGALVRPGLVELSGAPAEEVQATLLHLAATGQLAMHARRPSPVEEIALRQVLHRLSGELGDIVPALEPALQVIFDATPDSKIETLELCLGARFRLPWVGGGGGRAWKAEELRRTWRALERLPPGHVEDSQSFRALLREPETPRSVGTYYESSPAEGRVGTVSIAQADTMAQLDDETRALWAKKSPKDRAEDLRYVEQHPLTFVAPGDGRSRTFDGELEDFLGRKFDATVRHEVGHSVDALLHASDTYCRTAQGGGWKSYGKDLGAVLADFVATIGVTQTIAGVDLATFEAELRRVALDPLPLMEKEFRRDEEDTPAWRELVARQQPARREQLDYLRQMWSNLSHSSTERAPGARSYILRGDGWVSYENQARTRQVSDYQFTSEKEWFAEAYTAYYDPSAPRGQRLLEVGDEATKRYFDETVQPFVASKPPPAAAKR
jgi:hypothetical protein